MGTNGCILSGIGKPKSEFRLNEKPRGSFLQSGKGADLDCIFSIDVEDWFHILDLASTPELEKWDALPSHVERDFMHLLDILDENQVRITCFFLGWIGRKFPHLVQEAVKRGHEVASHGYAHRLVFRMTRDEFFRDALDSRKILEDSSGAHVCGYRSSGFSVTESTPWVYEGIAQAGYEYDSSVFPAARAHGGMDTPRLAPYRIVGDGWTLTEFPITVANLLGKKTCFFGGGYLRLFPYPIIHMMAEKVLRDDRPVIFYVHPREIEPGHPRLQMNMVRRFKSYYNLTSTEPKVRRILHDFKFTTFHQYQMEHDKAFGVAHV